MTASYYGAALLLSIPFTSMAQPAPPDSSAGPRRHLLTVHTLHIASPFVAAVGYEALVRSRWSVRASLGGTRDTYRYTSYYIDAAGYIVPGTGQSHRTHLLADASLNYYLQARKPALLGWFVGAGFLTAFTHIKDKDLIAPARTYRELAARPILRAGRHWALGRRWLVDTNVAVAIWSDPDRVVFLQEFIAVGAGYRF
jgi:hypothetical protein